MKSLMVVFCFRLCRRPPHGGRGLKFLDLVEDICRRNGRPPHGGRGLKSDGLELYDGWEMSPPARGAWIEISFSASPTAPALVAPRTGGVD